MSLLDTSSPTQAERARHELRAYFQNYGEDLGTLLSTLHATHAGVALDELRHRHGLASPIESVSRLLARVLEGLVKLPLQFRLDDGAFRPPYRNAAIRFEAEWHLNALTALAERLGDHEPEITN